jgi:catechol 2,3-dioxygenase-like lactoylglutathione lyase family enzyme
MRGQSVVIYDHRVGITGLDHINIDTSKPDETVAFYEDVLGLENRPQDRPDFGFPGAWLFLGDRPVVHLNFIDEDDRFANRSAFNHIAFEGGDFAGMCAMLDERGLKYRTSERPDIKLSQVFVDDPNGVRVEINIRG